MRSDADFMRSALALAEQGRGWVNPNPMVGAVVVRDGEVVGKGFHAKVGGPHAEVVALEAAGELARGATIYVTLEPCNHHGRTPPCTQALIRAGVAKVVFACWDQNPLTARQSREVLEQAGIEVVAGIEEAAALEINAPFFKWARTSMPYVLCKMAMTLDGKIATSAGKSQWISGPEARAVVQEWRATYAGIMVGVGTVLADDPSLTCRLEGAHQPARIVVDPLAATPPASRLFSAAGLTIIAVGPDAPSEAVERLKESGAEIVVCPKKPSADRAPGEFIRTLTESAGGLRVASYAQTGAGFERGASGSDIGKEVPHIEGIDLTVLMGSISRFDISSVLLEGGGGLNSAMIRQGFVDRVAFFVAPLLLGGRDSRTPMEGTNFTELIDAIHVHNLRSRPVGADILIEAELEVGLGLDQGSDRESDLGAADHQNTDFPATVLPESDPPHTARPDSDRPDGDRPG